MGIGGQPEGAEMTGGRCKPEDGDVDIPVEGKTAGPSPELTSNPFRFLFWNWITALMKTGYRKPLEVLTSLARNRNVFGHTYGFACIQSCWQ